MSRGSSGTPYKKIRGLLIRAIGTDDILWVEPLMQGFSNQCFRVYMDGGREYKVRIGGNNDVINRENETTILERLEIRSLYYDQENGDGVWEWIRGRTLLKRDIDEEMMKRVIGLVEKIHGVSGEGVLNHDDLEYVGRFGNRLGSDNLKLYLGLVEKYAEEERCLCHNDVSLSNLVYDAESKRLHLIDYEWGRVNHPYWEYGNFVKEVGLDREKVDLLCELSGKDRRKTYEFAAMAALYSIQLSYVFREQTSGLEDYRGRLFLQVEEYKRWMDWRG